MTPAEKQKRYRDRKSNALPVTDGNEKVTKSVTVTHESNAVTPKSVTTVTKSNTTVIPWCDISESRFDGYGRGIPVGGYVMVARKPTVRGKDGEFYGGECGVVTEAVWRARLEEKCVHGYTGWKCKPCLV